MKQIIINAGHWENDPGVTVGGFNERDLCMKIRDHLKELMPNAYYVPDSLNLKESIVWADGCFNHSDDAIAIDIHLNSNKDENVSGVECYYSDNKALASSLSKSVAGRLHIPNRGAKHDSISYYGSLGWCRQLQCPSVVLECGYLTSNRDTHAITKTGGTRKIAEAIFHALQSPDDAMLVKRISELEGQLQVLRSYIINYLKK